MTCGRVRLALTVVLLSTGATACPQYARQRPLVERLNSKVAPSRLRVLAAIAGGGSRTDLQISVTVRQQLSDSGVTVQRPSGRFDTIGEAVRAVCNPAEGRQKFDGVLFIWYNRLKLYDCSTQRAAYEISGGQLGITQMADRLILYLGRDTAAVPSK